MGDLSLRILTAFVLAVGLVAGLPAVSAQESIKLDSYAEWKRGGELLVDGQRVRVNAATKWKGKHTSIEAVPLGDEVRVTGTRQSDGTVLAREIDVRPNGANALFESDVMAGTAELEAAWLRNRQAFEPGEGGKVARIGEIADSGAKVDRVRRLVSRLAPPYVPQDKLRVYVIDNKEWNAMAMGNGAIWVFSGIMDDMSDNQLAVVVGHELAHYTHEHSRRQARRGIWTQLGGLAAILSAEAIDNDALRASVADRRRAQPLGAQRGIWPGSRGPGRPRGPALCARSRLPRGRCARGVAAVPGKVRPGRPAHQLLLLGSLAGLGAQAQPRTRDCEQLPLTRMAGRRCRR